MDRKVLILPFEDKDIVYEKNLKNNLDIGEQRHAVGYCEFIEKNGLEFDHYFDQAGYSLAVYLCRLGYVVLQIDDLSVVYLPEQLSSCQEQWLCSHKKDIRRWNPNIVDLDEGKVFHYDQFSEGRNSLFPKFREIIQNKKVIDYSSQLKKGGK